MSDRFAAALAEILGMLDGADAPGARRRAKAFTPVVTIYCAQCKDRGAVAIGHVYPTRQGMVLYAEWKRTRRADDTRSDAGPLMAFLSDPPPAVMEVDNWLGHCQHHGWRHLPAIEDLRNAAKRRGVSLRC